MLAVDPSAAGLSWHRTLEERGDLEEVERKVSPTLAAGLQVAVSLQEHLSGRCGAAEG